MVMGSYRCCFIPRDDVIDSEDFCFLRIDNVIYPKFVEEEEELLLICSRHCGSGSAAGFLFSNCIFGMGVMGGMSISDVRWLAS
jgi:hypothetical protein